MIQTLSEPERNADIRKRAERILRYETREKGAMGKLFGFDSRDGFWSKLIKTVDSASTALGGATFAFIAVSGLISGGVGIAVAGVAAVATGFLGGAISRAVNKSIFSDLHDSYQGNLGKFGHYMGVALAVGAVNAVLRSTLAILPGAGFIVSAVAAVVAVSVVKVLASKGIASGFGDPSLREENAEARKIAQKAIQSGQSVEQLLTHGTRAKDVPSEAIPENPEQSQAKRRSFTRMVEQQRANAQTLSIG